jgi:hypothetical protein
MAKNTSQLITDTKRDFARLQEELEAAKTSRDEYNRQLKNARERLKRREETTYPNKLAQSFVKNLKKGNVLKAMMIAAIDKAVETNGEFRPEYYKQALYDAAGDESIYVLNVIGAGWETRIVPTILFESSAGTLNDWAEGVESYRVELKSKGLNNEQAGERASAWWSNNVYSTGLEAKTFKGRMALANGKAPFWQILAYGTVNLASDRAGGYTTVTAKRTDDTVFVDNVEFALKESFDTTLKEERQKFFDEEQDLKQIIAEYEEKRDEYSEEVSRLRTDMKLNEVIVRSFKDKQEFVDKDILQKAINTIEDSRRKRVETINIAKAGSGLKLLITIKRAEGVIEY